jgi:hypothetical protein
MPQKVIMPAVSREIAEGTRQVVSLKIESVDKGKGVIVLNNRSEAMRAIDDVFPPISGRATNEELLAQDNMLWTTEGRKRVLALMAKAVEQDRATR